MDINERICSLLSQVCEDVFYVYKPDGYEVDKYMTFNFTINGFWNSDNISEMDKYYITVNFLTKNQMELNPMVEKLKSIIRDEEMCYGFQNRGTTYIKDSLEFFNASTFYMLVENKKEVVENPIEPTE